MNLQKKTDRKIYYIMRMSDHDHMVEAAMRAYGYDMELCPESNEDNYLLARQYCSGKECYPGILSIGDLLRKVNSDDFDPDKTAFYYLLGNAGPCRTGQYSALAKNILEELGYADIPIYTHVYPDKRFTLPLNPKESDAIIDLIFNGMTAVDILLKVLHETRPYEVKTGETDQVYRKALMLVKEAITNRKSMVQAMKAARKLFDAVEVKKGARRPLIALLGETFVRLNSFANGHIVRKLEKLGVEVWMAPLLEWPFAASYKIQDMLLKRKMYGRYLQFQLKQKILLEERKGMLKAFKGYLSEFGEVSMKKCMEKFKPYMDFTTMGCDAPWRVAGAVEFIEMGADGIISLMPFTCLPGNMFNSFLIELQEDFKNFPFLVIPYEGLEETNIDTRLEAFVYQIKELKQKASSGGKKR